MLRCNSCRWRLKSIRLGTTGGVGLFSEAGERENEGGGEDGWSDDFLASSALPLPSVKFRVSEGTSLG